MKSIGSLGFVRTFDFSEKMCFMERTIQPPVAGTAQIVKKEQGVELPKATRAMGGDGEDVLLTLRVRPGSYAASPIFYILAQNSFDAF